MTRLCICLTAMVLILLCLTSTHTRALGLLMHTVLLVAGTLLVSLPLGMILAIICSRTDLFCRKGVACGLFVLLLIPVYLQCAAWQAGFGTQGWFTLLWGGQPLLSGWCGAIWVHAMAALPWVVVIVAVGFRYVEPALEEQAMLDGTSGQVFRQVTLRQVIPSLAIAAIWITVTTAGEMTVTDLFQIRTYAEEVYTDFALGPPAETTPLQFWSDAAITGILLIAATVVCARLAPGKKWVNLSKSHRLALQVWSIPVTISTGCLLMIVVGVPLGNLLYKTGIVVTQLGDQRLRTWSWQKCVAALFASVGDYHRELWWSLIIAFCAASTVLALAIALAWIARSWRHGSGFTLVITATALAIPGPILGLAIIDLLNRPNVAWLLWLYDYSILPPWLAQTVRSLPLPVLIVWHAFATIPSETLDSALADGAGPFKRFVQLVWPLRWHALVAAWLVAFVVAWGELAATILVLPPGMTTLPVRIFALLHYGVEDQVAAICLVVVLILSVVTIVLMVYSRLLAEQQATPTTRKRR